MDDRERLIDILERAGYMTQLPGTLARILMEHGLRFAPAVPGHENMYDISEMAYKNGKEADREAVLNLLRDMKGKAIGAERRALDEAINAIQKLEVRP